MKELKERYKREVEFFLHWPEMTDAGFDPPTQMYALTMENN